MSEDLEQLLAGPAPRRGPGSMYRTKQPLAWGLGLVGVGLVGALLLATRRASASTNARPAPPAPLEPPRTPAPTPEPSPSPPPMPRPSLTTRNPFGPGNPNGYESLPGVYGPPKTLDPESSIHPSEFYDLGSSFPARLTEFHPDAPENLQGMEGGPNDTRRVPLITIEQYLSDPQKYPYVSVASDEVLHGVAVAYGTRIYFEGLPPELRDVVFRLVDTGGNFRAPIPGRPPDPKRNKQIRKAGREPFDIATNYPGKGRPSRWGLSGKLTTARLDMRDVLTDPRQKRPRAPNA